MGNKTGKLGLGIAGAVIIFIALPLIALMSASASAATQKWEFEYDGRVQALTEEGDDTFIYLKHDDKKGGALRLCNLIKLDPDKQEIWRTDLEYFIEVLPLDDGRVVVGGMRYVALLDNAGNVLWKYTVQDTSNCFGNFVVTGDGTIFALENQTTLHVLSEADGSLLWEFGPGGHQRVNKPELAPDGSILLSEQGLLHCLNPDGSLRWQYTNPVLRSTDISSTGEIYVIDTGNNLYQLDGSTGLVSWQYTYAQHNAQRSHMLCFLGPADEVYYYEFAGALMRIDAQGQLMWTYNGTHTLRGRKPGVWRATANSDGTVLLCEGSFLVGLNPDGTQKWEAKLAGLVDDVKTRGEHILVNISKIPILPMSSISKNTIFCLDANGTQIWRHNYDDREMRRKYDFEVGTNIYFDNWKSAKGLAMGSGTLICIGE